MNKFFKHKTIIFLGIILAVLILPKISQAATINVVNLQGQPSCAQVDVQTAINSASNGDIVSVPTGNCTWSSQVSINATAITLQGAGIDQTFITANYSSDDSGTLAITGHATLNTIIKGFTFYNTSSKVWYYAIRVGGSYSNTGTVRITGNKFNTTLNAMISFNNNQTTLLDNNTFNIGGSQAIETVQLYGDGAASWTRADNFGSGTGLVIMEDNVFDGSTSTAGGWAKTFTSFDGARFVFRYNTITNLQTDAHPNTWAHTYGVRQIEVYNNNFINVQRIVDFKAGTFVIYNNTTNNSAPITLHAPTLFYRSDTNSQCCLTSNLNNVACKQRPGFGFNYTLDPVYIWGNTNNTPTFPTYSSTECDAEAGGHQNTANALRANIEYYSGVERPGYSAFIYPHPLTFISSPPPDTIPPAAPTGLAVI